MNDARTSPPARPIQPAAKGLFYRKESAISPPKNSVSMLHGAASELPQRRLKDGWSYIYWNNTAHFPQEYQDRIYSVLVEISTKAFGADMTPYWSDRKKGRFFEKISKFCLLVDPLGNISGWTGYHRRIFGNAHCLYLDSSGVLPDSQGGGLMGHIHAKMIALECLNYAPRPVYLVARTESPVVYRLLRNGCGPDNIWPAPDTAVDRQVSLIATDVAEWLGQSDKFDPGSLRILGAYDNLDALYGDLPSCGDPTIDAFFRTTLRPEDAYIVIARAGLPRIARQWAKREIKAVRAAQSQRLPWLASKPAGR
ncbi:hypothetical protein [Streptomyces sp. CB02923]|uniref:hypothetical protein n=1 Tax=Streptomyces sp. CB02923 TaxID=1718985 RepID=UPI000AFCB872|nr:hypothetical protein [Streptomyces sp. CB02923]